MCLAQLFALLLKLLLNPSVFLIKKCVSPKLADYLATNGTNVVCFAEAGMKNATALWPLRIAISGQMSTPGGAIEIAWLLGKDECLRRIDLGIAKLG